MRITTIIRALILAGILLTSGQESQAQGRRGRPVISLAGVDDIGVAANSSVQKELSVNADQIEKLKDLATDVREEWMQQMASAGIDSQALRDLSPEQRAAKFAEISDKTAEVNKRINEKFQPKLAEVLNKAQLKRVHEIALQAAGARALLDAGVQKDLELTTEQRDKIASISKDLAKQIAQLPAAERTTKLAELNDEQLAKSTEVLTKEQQTQFAALKGKPFDVKLLGGRRGGGRTRVRGGAPGTGLPD